MPLKASAFIIQTGGQLYEKKLSTRLLWESKKSKALLSVLYFIYSNLLIFKKGADEMEIFVDADASPVKKEIIEVAGDFDLPVTLVSSVAHHSTAELPENVQQIYVDSSPEAADYKIIRLAESGDLVITQDYGLASLLLGNKVYILHHTGRQISADNIDYLLARRHYSAQARQAGVKTKGPQSFTAEDRQRFKQALHDFLSRHLSQ